ncbi:hypothetical protein ACGFW5_05545 [Streptomyces sp. NPDC048416]|uniref:hypothetical protein n=1 Tax=Streptomyces sp. NPDC048416 TaxID=3365546 RepID=UPI00371340C5
MRGPDDRHIRVPVGEGAARWATRGRCRRVLLVVHNVTSATRLLDVLPLFHDDLRIQLLATCTGSSAFQGGVEALLAETGVPVLPWEQALETKVDLAITSSLGGQLHRISGQLALLSHGAGYNKTLATPDAGCRMPDAGCRMPDAGCRMPDAGCRMPDAAIVSESASRREPSPESALATPPAPASPVFGLSREWLLHKGVPVADAMVLSHPEQLDRLRAACAEAVPTAVLAGDPCYDRMLAARPYRERFRRALGVRRGQRLVLLNSTWNPESLFGDGGGDDVLPSLLPRLTAELPGDEYRVAAVLHPNIWHGHGPGQIRAWLDQALRGGLALVDPLHDWRQALLAADVVLGDHGSVSYYAAALGIPVLLGSAPTSGLDTRSPVAAFVRQAPRFEPHTPLAAQLDALVAGHRPLPGPACLTTSAPGESAALLRSLFYRLIGIPEPERPALLEPLRLPPYQRPPVTAPLSVLTRVTTDPCEIHAARHADPRYESEGEGHAHTAIHEDARDTAQLDLADVLFREGEPDDPRFGSPAQWTSEALGRHPHSSLAAYITGPGECTVRTRTGHLLHLTCEPGGLDGLDPAAAVSALHAWLTSGRTVQGAVDEGLTVRTGATVHRVRVAT